MVLAFLVLIGLLFQYEFSRISRYGGGKREKVAFSALMAIALAFGTALILDLPVPNPLKGLEAIFKPLGEMVVPPD